MQVFSNYFTHLCLFILIIDKPTRKNKNKKAPNNVYKP